ncbi:MAG: ORF6N domain-containing protein [Ignavibacteriaceae bacterium]|nr:ORF6N domain-containing protein [Ignavibacteriaceae bacterium]
MGVNELLPTERIESKILLIRGQKVILDRDLAELYGVETKNLNRQVKRNPERFPSEFMFQLTLSEKIELVTDWHRFNSLKHSTVLPFAFTEYGALMLASVLNSQRAIEAGIYVVRAFVKLKEILSTHKELAQKLKELEYKIETHDEQITAIFEAINQLLAPPPAIKRKIGFEVKEKGVKYAAK